MTQAAYGYDVVFNRFSGSVIGKERTLRDQIRSGLGRRLRTLSFLGGDEISEAAQDWRTKNGDPREVFVIAGGDGTFNGVARGFINTPHRLGLLPLGTFNLVAGALNVPMKLSQALKAYERPQHVSMNVGDVNGHPFFANVVFDELSLNLLSAREAWRHGDFMAVSRHTGRALDAIFSSDGPAVNVQHDGGAQDHKGRAYMVTNGRLADRAEIAAEPSGAGKLLRQMVPFLRVRRAEGLSFYNIGSGTTAGFFKLAAKMAANDDWKASPDVAQLQASSLRVDGGPPGTPVDILTDAERVSTTWPLDFSCGQTLNVVVPGVDAA